MSYDGKITMANVPLKRVVYSENYRRHQLSGLCLVLREVPVWHITEYYITEGGMNINEVI